MNWRSLLTWRHAGVEEARQRLEESRDDREEVERLTRDLNRRGRVNHFSEDLGQAFRGRRARHNDG